MRVICQYHKSYDILLKDMVVHTIMKHEGELDLSGLEEIVLVDQREIQFPTDGRVVDGRQIVLSSRLFEQLPTCNIQELLAQENENFQMILNTLYHEMGHISDQKKYPQIYEYANHIRENDGKGSVALFWTEYLAEKRTAKGNLQKKHFCEQFSKRGWKITKNNISDATCDNFFYLNKILPYFIARTDERSRRKYLEKTGNQILIAYEEELRSELSKLEQEAPFDDIGQLDRMDAIMDEYYHRFCPV